MGAAALNQQPELKVSDRVQIVTMLYDGSLNFIGKAKEKIEVGDAIGRTHFIKKTSAIVKAEINNSVNALNDAENVMEILRSSWKEMQEVNKF